MNPANKCCFCLSLQTGCIMIALLELFLSGMNIDYIMYLLNRTYSRETEYKFPDQVLYTILQLIPDLLSVLASCMLLISIISQYFCLFWTTLTIQAIQAVYLVLFSIISAAITENLIINESLWHNITYWLYVVIWLALTLYFMYIIYSYYRQLKQRETENLAE
nr:uncharacterized protein LOC108060807 [Drosophila takahashii]